MGKSVLLGMMARYTSADVAVVGLIGEYLGRMFLAVNRKPQYLVREVFHRGPAGLELEVQLLFQFRHGTPSPLIRQRRTR